MHHSFYSKNVHNVESFYKERQETFQLLTKLIAEIFLIDETYIQFQIKRDITNTSYRQRINNTPKIIDFTIYLSFIIYFLISFLMSFFNKKSSSKNYYDFIYDHWPTESKEATSSTYQFIKNQYPQRSHFDLPTKDGRYKLLIQNTNEVFYRTFFIQFFPILIRLSFASQHDGINLIALFNSYFFQGCSLIDLVKKIKCRHFISCGDVYMGGLRYSLIKKHTKASVTLIQQFIGNGGQTALDNYRISDNYFLFSPHQRKLLPNLRAKNIFYSGDVRFKQQMSALPKESHYYDIALVDHYPDYIEGLCTPQAFYDLVSFTKMYALANPHLKIIYLYRPNRYGFVDIYGELGKERMKKLDKILEDAPFLRDDKLSSLEKINMTSVTISYTSTMWMEALGLGKKILVYNPEKLKNRPYENENLEALTRSDYQSFSNKLSKLLNLEEQGYFESLKKEYYPVKDDLGPFFKEAIESIETRDA